MPNGSWVQSFCQRGINCLQPPVTEQTHLLNGRVTLHQPQTKGLRAGLDAVMLAHFVPAQPNQQVLDLGCATGAVGLCIAARVGGIHLTGVDAQSELVAIAAKNATVNNHAESAQFVVGDIRDTTLLMPDTYDHVVFNPPYNQPGAWTAAPDLARQKAMGAVVGDATLADWVLAARRWCKPKGMVSLIYPAKDLPAILHLLDTGFGGVRIWPLHPKQGHAASRVVVSAVKGRVAGCDLLPPLVLHENDGTWTAAANAILSPS